MENRAFKQWECPEAQRDLLIGAFFFKIKKQGSIMLTTLPRILSLEAHATSYTIELNRRFMLTCTKETPGFSLKSVFSHPVNLLGVYLLDNTLTVRTYNDPPDIMLHSKKKQLIRLQLLQIFQDPQFCAVADSMRH